MKKFRGYIQILISLALLVLLLNLIDFNDVVNALENVNIFYIFLALLVVTLDRIVMAFKWRILLKVKGIQISLPSAVKIYYISNFIGLVLPATIGCDLTKTYLVSKKNYSASDVVASILVERFMGILTLVIFILASMPLFFNLIDNLQMNYSSMFFITAAILIIGVVTFFLSFTEKFYNIISSLVKPLKKKKFFVKIFDKIAKLIISYKDYKTKKGVLLFFFALTFLEIFMIIVVYFLVATSFNLDISLLYFIAFIPIVMFLARIPISINGLGITEGSMIYFLSLVGVASSVGFSVAVVNHLVLLVGILPGALFYAMNKNIHNVKDPKSIQLDLS